MKKHFLKSFALLAMLFSAITMSAATKYCGDQVQSTVDNQSVSIGVTILKVGDVLRVSFESEHISGIRGGGTFQQWGNGVWANQDDAVANFKDGWTQNGTIWTKDFAFSTYPTSGTGQIYCLFDIVNAGAPPVAGFTLTDIDLFATCDETPGEGGEDPVDPTPEPETPGVVYCDFPTGHEGNATFGDPDGRILVSVIKKSETTVRLVVKSAEEANRNLDLLYVEAAGANPNATTVGSDVAESDLREMFVDITYPTAPAKYTFMIQWSHPDWTGRWQTNLNDITVEQLCTEGGTEGGDEPDPTPEPEPEAPTVYCDFPTGHLNNADFGDANGRCLLTLTKISDKEVRVTVKPNYANGATKKMDYLYVISSGGTPYPAEAGADAAEGGYDELSVDITYASAPATYSFTIQWSNVADEGRWQVTLENIAPEQLCTEGTEGGEEPDPTPTEVYDVNFALASNGSSAEATSGDATAAIDNNAGSRWESAQEDPQTWTLDLGQARIFNTLEIVWEGAYGKTFTVSASDDKETWTPIWTVEGQELAGFPYTQTQTIDKTTARYIQFHGTERGTGYGYSFWEFRVYLAGESTFTSLEAKPATNLSKVGEGNVITLTAKDQNGQVMADAGEVTYTITPADAGTITNNIYTPAKIGLATIVATIGEVSAPAFEVFAYDGENVALSTDINTSKIVAQSDFAPSGTDAWHAIDGNEESVWQGSATNGTANDEAARTFDAWFVVDFGAYYDINLVSIQFEGACSQEYHVDFSADNATWNVAYNYAGYAGINRHTKLIYGNDLQNTTKVRYARFYSTKAATEWGMKIYELKVFGTPFVASGDTEKPVMGTATLVSKTHKSAIIAVSATDNDEVASYHVVCTNPAYEQTLSPTDGKITLNNLTPATTYNFTITAIDLAGNESENAATVECTTNIYNAKPTSAPTPPTHDAKQVKSVFSDVYGGTFSAMEGWGQATQFEELNFNGDYVRYYTNLNYLGWATGSPINASVMEKLHLDIWAAEDATIIIVPIYGGQGLTTDDKKTKTVTLKGQEWNSIDLTLATDFAGLDLSSIFQFKFDAPQGTDKFAIDNVYFYTTQVSSDVTPPTNITATAVPSFTTAVINCQATDESGSISYEVYLGSELKGTGSADSDATASITVTNLQPNREFTMTVIATDVYGNESAETVDVTFTTLSYPAPAPTPTWDAAKVFSIYSDAYTTTVARAFGWGWGASTVEAEVELATSDKALQYTTSNYAGWELNGNTSIGTLTAYPYLHMDIYVENAGSIQFTPIWGAEALKEYTLEAGWNSLDINLVEEFTGINLENIYQLKWAAMPATCFIDNVYFFDGLIEGVVINDDSDLTQLRDGFIYNLTLKRNFVMDEDWNTICLPFALDADQVKEVFGEHTTLVKLQSFELISDTEINLVFADVTAMEASTPYLIKPKKNVDTGVALKGVVINLTPNVIETTDADAKMIPVLKTQSFTGADNTFYLGANENLYPRPSSGQIKAMRAYFQFPNLTAEQASKLRARVVCEENEETALDNISGQKQKTGKVIYNGQLIIIRNGEMYNAQGIKL